MSADDIEQASLLSEQELIRTCGLLLVRYFGWSEDEKFTPWFDVQRGVIADIAAAGERIAADGDPSPLLRLADRISGILDEVDPDCGTYETDINDHLLIAWEVVEFFDEPSNLDLLAEVFDHVDSMSGATHEVGNARYPGRWDADFAAMEAQSRTLDMSDAGVSEKITNSRSFAAAHSDFVMNFYTDEEAGRA